MTSGTKAAKVSSRRAAPGASRRSGTKKAVPKGLSFSQDIEEI